MLNISGIQDIKLQKASIDSIALNLNITFSGSVHDTISLSISGLPQGININPNAILSGVSNFNTRLVFYDTSTTICPFGDVYPITITCTNSVSIQKTFKFNLFISPIASLATSLAGIYTNCIAEEEVCADDRPINYVDEISVDACIPNRIYFNNFGGSGLMVYANVIADPSHQQNIIIIPGQSVDSTDYIAADTGVYKNGEIVLKGESFRGNVYDAISMSK